MSEHQGDVTNGPARDLAWMREELAQVRAIVRSIAERDVSDDLQALRSTVEELRTRDVNGAVREDLAELRRMVADVAATDPAGELRADLAPIEAGLVRVAELLMQPEHTQAVSARIDAVTARIDALEVTLTQRLESVASAGQVRDLTGDLRAQLADAVAPFEQGALTGALDRLEREVTSGGQAALEVRDQVLGLRTTVDAVVDRGESEAASVSTLLDEVREALLDVASGEVVGALWDEFRSARMTLDLLAARQQEAEDADTLAEMRAELATLHATVVDLAEATAASASAAAAAALAAELDEDAGDAAREAAEADDSRLVALRDDLATLGERVGLLLTDVRSVLDRPSGPDPAMLTAIVADVAALREELSRGLIVEPSEALTGTVDALRDEVAEVRGGLASIRQLEGAVADVQVELAAAAERMANLPVEQPAPPEATDAAAREVLADQLASLRDEVVTELDGLRQQLDRAAAVSEEPADHEPTPVAVTVDPDTVALLLAEIRAAGGVSDAVIEALRKELKALRRRIVVRAREEILSEEQLEIIADAVARKLAD